MGSLVVVGSPAVVGILVEVDNPVVVEIPAVVGTLVVEDSPAGEEGMRDHLQAGA